MHAVCASTSVFGMDSHAAHWRAQDTQVPTGYLGSKEGADTLKGHSTTGMVDRVGEAQGGLGTGALLKEHADASKDQARRRSGVLSCVHIPCWPACVAKEIQS